MTAVIDQSRHVTDWITIRLVGGRIQDMDRKVIEALTQQSFKLILLFD